MTTDCQTQATSRTRTKKLRKETTTIQHRISTWTLLRWMWIPETWKPQIHTSCRHRQHQLRHSRLSI